MKYRKKPVVIEAMQVPEEGVEPSTEFLEFIEQNSDIHSDRDEGLAIHTLEGTMRADPGDYIIKGVQGEFYPCKPDIFEQTYEAVGDDL